MKYFILLGGLLLTLTPLRVNAALMGTCSSDTLASYTAGGTCVIGDKTFGNFAAVLTSVSALGTATPNNLNSILVVPGGISTNPSFSFQAAYNASGVAASESLTLLYNGFAPINDPFTGVNLSLSGASVSGPAAITAAEALCINGGFVNIQIAIPPACSSGVAINAALLSQITNANLGATIQFNFAPALQIGVLKQITLTGV